jgi:hypothetical protein
MRAIVVATANLDAIADGAILYSCAANIRADTAVGTYPLTIGALNAGAVNGASIAVSGTNGAIRVTAAPTACAPHCCPGDCDGSGAVEISELLSIVNGALSHAPAPNCPAGDLDGDGQITIDEIMRAVNSALHGCS